MAWLVLAAVVAASAVAGPAQADRTRGAESAGPVAAEAAGAGLPRIVGERDAARYRQIFDLQKKGKWRSADREIRKLRSRILMGHVLAQRYLHPTKYRSRYGELERWLRHYADHPEARRIYRLAKRRKGKSSRHPRAPTAPQPRAYESSWVSPTYGYTSPRRRSASARAKVHKRIRVIRRHALRGHLKRARQILSWRSSRRMLDKTETAIARAHLARGYFFHGSPETAHRISARVADRAGRYMPMAHWIAGLSAYRVGAYGDAARHLETMAEHPTLSSWPASGAAFWAGRANLLAGKPDRVRYWMNRASEHRFTFYGQLAARVLGLQREFDWRMPQLTAENVAVLIRHPAARRALALLQVNAPGRAESELKALTSIDDSTLARALMALAEKTSLASLAVGTAAMLDEADGPPPTGALYPVPGWRPEEGFTVDRALIYAFMRQESRFKVRAKSHAGARGLMQLMPGTAGFMMGKRYRGSRRNELYDPGLNISIAQRYIRYLIRNDVVKGNVLMLAAAYNGGPGNLNKWRRRAARRKATDPLIFIETIPARETRNYVERVLANLWMYRSRLGQGTPTLDRLAAGKAPLYKSLDGAGNVVARNERN
ncbi:MAG: lytic transglycosylase domain-containing protein [Defluviicoccus sp.]|nr:lytic transglycosylase domain-containing protein [Defluviicoccus sp.]MDE0382979.1 lytic transglycosylase domain-containing protein [Defluviicoccus sp.]